MPLPYLTITELAIGATSFNSDAIAVLAIHGTSYGGDWGIIASVGNGETVGEIETHHPDAASMVGSDAGRWRARETAYVWVHDQAVKRRWRVLAWKAIEFPADQRPYFIAAQALIGGEAFVPAPGAGYADEMTLDQLMAGGARE